MGFEALKAELAVIKAKALLLKAASRWPAGAPQGKGGQFAPKTVAGGLQSTPTAAKWSAGGANNTFHETGWAGSGLWGKPSTPPPGAKPHPQVDDKGKPVTINYPTRASHASTWSNPSQTATFTPGGEAPGTLNGVPMKPWNPPHEGWAKVGGTDEALDRDFPFEPHRTKKTGAGVLIVEDDGRVWLTTPTNSFGGYKNTYPKGTAESGLTLQQNAIKEAWEETGLKVKIVGVLGDYERDTSKARMYIAQRVGGTPKNMGWESQAMRLATMKDANTLLNKPHDREILDDLSNIMGIAKAAPKPAAGAWAKQPRWPRGTALGGQWKTMDANGLSEPPAIAGGLSGKNTVYQKVANAAYAAAQSGDLAALQAAIDKYQGNASKYAEGIKSSSHVKWGAQVHQYATQVAADATAKTKASASADAIKGPIKLSEFKQVGAKPGGTNPGALYKHPDEPGSTYLVKGNKQLQIGNVTQAVSDDRAKNEVLAAKLLLAAGAGAPVMGLVNLEGEHGGGLGVASLMVEGASSFKVGNSAHLAAIQGDFAIHAWLANYDVLGMGFDNTVIKDGKAINIDPGGALLFRAQGLPKELKGGVLDPSAPEFESMRSTTGEQQAVFGKMTSEQLKASAAKLALIDDATIGKLVNTYGPGDDKAKAALTANLIARKNAILAKAGLATSGFLDAAPAPSVQHAQHKIDMPTGVNALKPIGIKSNVGQIYVEHISEAHAAADVKALQAIKDNAFTPMSATGKMIYDGDGKKAITAYLDAAIKDAQDKQDGLKAKVSQAVSTLAEAGKKIVENVKADSYKIIDPMLKDAAEHHKTLVQAINAASAKGDLDGLGLCAATAKMNLNLAKNEADLDNASEVWAYATDHIANAKAAIAASAKKIAESSNDYLKELFGASEGAAKPEFKAQSANVVGFYNKLADKASALHASGDLSGLKALATSKDGKYFINHTSPNSKLLQAHYAALVNDLEAKQAAQVTATVQAAQKALAPEPHPPKQGEAKPPLPAMPTFSTYTYPSNNTNAASHNKKIAVIADLATKGDVKGILSMSYATNSPGKLQVKAANAALAALGSSHTVSPGQKKNENAGLYNSVQREAMAAAAATVKQPTPEPHPATKDGTSKTAFKPENLMPPPDFTSQSFYNAATSKYGPPSSKAHVNEANTKDAKAVYGIAVKGDLEALKNATYEVLNKESGKHTGIFKSYAQHPSQHISAYWQNLVQEVDAQLNPPTPIDLGKTARGASLAEAASKLKAVPSDKVKAVKKSQKAGFYIVLGKIDPALGDHVKANNTEVSSEKWRAATKAHYGAAPSAAKETFGVYVSTSGARALNTALREGKPSTSYGGKTVAQHAKDFNGLLVDIPEGSTFVRNMGNKGYGTKVNPKEISDLQQFLLNADKGTVVQEPGFSSSSFTGANSILGGNDIQWNFTAGPGVKAFPAWLSANASEGESLFPPNTRYLIRSAKKVGKTVVVDAILLPND